MKRVLERTIFHSVTLTGTNLLILATLGIAMGSWWVWTGFFIVFVYYYAADKFLKVTGVGNLTNRDNEFDFISPANPSFVDRYRIPYYAVVQILFLPISFYLLTFKSHSTFEFIGGLASIVFSAGSIGGLAGHELIHDRNPYLRWLGILTLTTMNYGHFAISHVLGHHKDVGLKHDWSTARYRESVYHFLYRAIVHGYRGAWVLENQRLRNRKISPFSLRNEMIQITFIQIAFTSAILLLGGIPLFITHSIFSLVAISLLEVVNYVSHYGLTRRTTPEGRLERTANVHSWEANNKVNNWFIFNAGKHAHHHRNPSEKNYEFVFEYENPPLPWGLQELTLIAFIPPLYFKAMDKLFAEKALNQSRHEIKSRPTQLQRRERLPAFEKFQDINP